MLGVTKLPGHGSSTNDQNSKDDPSKRVNNCQVQSPELYKRFLVSTGVYALFGTIISGTIGSIALKSPISRRFALGVGFGAGLGWGVKSANDFIKYTEKRNFVPPFPKSSDEWIDKGVLTFQKFKNALKNAVDKKE
ncbi:hypothetical protein [Cryptosporidium parvum Iowa II]|uniref:Transmembrane protein n=2 Tax=Cryptosporidium parvum TaxID=5807 RepID=Q5CQ04_CRYPI|nr:hypothetical protein [Cryptosporidium parvum Iowa II]EAK87465.1 hypothetical protein cgd8_110 [Cryptosporidium parvum Iowa II]QOY39757.1 Uncharacterized protein CPATCC_0000110 [Cryptosporidium parvum]WKS79257.1 hypothetical protein CPCDC_8g110 [Cryptosporidium sp. 43IA8]WRK33753.1 Uncharacterized protein cpbgf_800110 [Cryptosporidium parvum]|eukprot:QOY39757.1 hypothetical protein CPATCC_003795 [Cryptosporidium parvum]